MLLTDVIYSEAKALAKLASDLDIALMEKLNRKILALDGRVIMTGVGKSGLIGAKIAATLASTGTPSQFVHTGDAGHGDLGMITKDDLVIALSHSGQSREFLSLITYCQRQNIPLASVTTRPESRLAKASTFLILLPDFPEACPLGLAPMTSTTMQLAWGDALAASLIDTRGFKKDDFALRHMGGTLGVQTKTLAEYFIESELEGYWHKTEYINDDAHFVDITIAISKGRRGAVLVTSPDNDICGIITDGDVRRAVVNGMQHGVAKDIMTPSLASLPDTAHINEAVKLMQSKRINVLAIHAECGTRLIHIQDLLRLGL